MTDDPSPSSGQARPTTEDGEPAFTFGTLAIVGLGLMGGSLALKLKENDAGAPFAPKIIGITRTRKTLDAALERGAIDLASDQLSAARAADVIVLAAPVRTILAQTEQLATIAQDGALILDMGSTKRAIVQAMNALPKRLRAVGGHPMCGKEVAGFDAAEANLYQDKVFVLARTERTTPDAFNIARALALSIGSRVIELDAERHDQIVGAISHLPYVVASNLVETINALSNDDGLLMQLASSGYRDTTRVAAGDINMMLDILVTNRDNVSQLMRDFASHFAELARVIDDGDVGILRQLLERTAEMRREWHNGQ
jgi:prephenate dehydrogenase